MSDTNMRNVPGRINQIAIMCIDAYGVACKNGFKGTVDEWLDSLEGEKGDPGYSPVKGVDYWTDEDFAQMYDSLAHEFSLGMTFLDHTTGKKCRLYLDDGKFLVEEVG